MKKIYTLLAAAVLTASVSTFADNVATISVTPDPASTYETCPAEIVLTYDGVKQVKKPVIAYNPAKLTNPNGATQMLQATFPGDNTIKLTCPASFQENLTVAGEYKIEVLAKKYKLVWEDGTTDNEAYEFTYTVGAAQPETGVILTPDPSKPYESFPTEFTLTFNGATSLKKAGLTAPNPIKITGPDGKSQVLSLTFKDNVVTCKLPATPNTDITKSGDYTFALVKDALTITWEDGTTTKNEAQTWRYTVTGNGEDEDDTVKYDLTVIKYNPITEKYDIKDERTWETVQFTLNAGDVKPIEGASVTIKGPGYNATSALEFNMGTASATWLNAKFEDPKFNGEYTLTIPKGSFGTPAWIENPEKGRTNDEIVYKFEVIGGEDFDENSVDTSLGIVYNPAMGAKVETFDKVTLTFEEKVFYDEEATVNASVMKDFASTAYSPFGTVTFTRISDTVLEAVFSNEIDGKGQYRFTIPEGFFWNEEHENNPKGGKVNAAQTPYWFYMPITPTAEVLSTVPAEGAKISHFPAGYEVVIDTDNNEEVAYMTLTLTQYENDSDTAAPKTLLNGVKSEAKTEDGAICWKNGEEMMIFSNKYYYELSYSLFNDKDQELASGIITFDGDNYVGINEVSFNATDNSIFTVQGIRVNRKVSELPAGLYIINGKKVIRK